MNTLTSFYPAISPYSETNDRPPQAEIDRLDAIGRTHAHEVEASVQTVAKARTRIASRAQRKEVPVATVDAAFARLRAVSRKIFVRRLALAVRALEEAVEFAECRDDSEENALMNILMDARNLASQASEPEAIEPEAMKPAEKKAYLAFISAEIR